MGWMMLVPFSHAFPRRAGQVLFLLYCYVLCLWPDTQEHICLQVRWAFRATAAVAGLLYCALLCCRCLISIVVVN